VRIINFDDMSVLEEVPFYYSPDALCKMIDLSEDAIYKGKIMTTEQLKARHPRL